MGYSVDDYAEKFDNNPKRAIRNAILWIIGIVIMVSVIGGVLGWFSEAADVAKKEFGAEASLKKYEWFKDCSETIQEKRRTIKVYEQNVVQMKIDYEGAKRKDWDRLDKQQYNQWTLEVTGLKASYNKVVKEYNAQSSKFNWSMYNTSDLPVKYDMYMSE